MSRPAPALPEEGLALLVLGIVYLELLLPLEAQAPLPGEEVFVEDLPLGVGGALNAASVAHALGTRTTLGFPRPEGPYGGVAHEAAALLGVETWPWPTRTAPPVSLIFRHPGDRAFLSAAHLEAFDECPPLTTARWVLVAGLREAGQLERQLVAARSTGTAVCVCGSWAPEQLEGLRAGARPPWDLLVLNEKEAQVAAAGAPDPLEALAAVVPDVVITRGERGSRARLGGQRLEVAATPATAVVDPTGAGDAFCAGLLHALLRGAAPGEALVFASKVAARVVGNRGGAVFDTALFEGLELGC
jgi:sugar/nucleoside kinase (ribokinase family)